MIAPSFNAFSLRRLNPFSGTLQVFASPTARALSSNGLNWEIQILSDSPQGLWANTPLTDQKYYAFGIWSVTRGLQQVPLHPLLNMSGMIDSAQELIEGLAKVQDRLPFPCVDHYELWLLDEETAQPIALLASAQLEADRAANEVERWVAAARGDFSFVSQHLSRRHLPVNDGHNPRVHASVLEALVRGRGGQNHRRAWYWRKEDGAGKAIQSQEKDLPAESFPRLPLTLDWDDSDDRTLIMDYISWKAPQILLLSDLPPETRDSIEQLAVKRPALIERYWRLYPEIHNEPRLNIARVEAKIRSTNQDG